MLINDYFEKVLSNVDTLRESILAMDNETLSAFCIYIEGRISYVDADQSMKYWYAASVLKTLILNEQSKSLKCY